jgi:hypothetical protein
MATINHLVLIYYEDQPMTYARIEDILPDHKPGWYHVKLMLLQIPLQVVTWILRDIYIEGAEYTMGGKKMRIEKVVCPEVTEELEELDELEPREDKSDTAHSGKVISLADLKKK